jgi:uncharacterized phage protein gp47/JayE
MAFTVKAFDQIIADMVSWIVSNSPNLTDLSPGSVIRSYCEGASLAIEEVYVGLYLGFRRYLDNVQETVFDFDRKVGTKASADVVFSRTVANGEITIPVGTRIKTASGLRFLTTAVATIPASQQDSNAVEAEAESVGTAYNVSSATIVVLEDTIAGVDTVTNALAATGGVDAETDIAYKNRFQAYVEGLGRSNLAGLTAGALSVEGITSVSIVELFPPVSDVNVDLYIDDGSSGGVSTAKVTEVQDVIDGDGTEENPGYRAAGINVVVKKPSVVSQNISATLSVISGVDTDQLESDVIDALTAYVNTLSVGEDIIYNELIASIMGVYGVSNVSLTTPAADVAIAATQVGRIGTVTLLGV